MRRFVYVAMVALALPSLAAESDAEVAARLLDAALASEGAWIVAAHLTDRIGPRLSGSPQAERAVAWTAETMRSWGL
ncbi:MAG TPA: peptidase M28, partial [Thermoanaerobaculia bacterium]|nr:peptidase M28 [Thermoanaerobaculia bacterium]